MTQQMQRSFRSASCNALSARYVGVSSLYYGITAIIIMPK